MAVATAQSVWQLATDWTIHPVGGKRPSAPVQTGPEAQSASCAMVNGSYPGVKRPKCGAYHPPPDGK